jgi:hypothetical protein
VQPNDVCRFEFGQAKGYRDEMNFVNLRVYDFKNNNLKELTSYKEEDSFVEFKI